MNQQKNAEEDKLESIALGNRNITISTWSAVFVAPWIAENDYDAYKAFCEQAEQDLSPIESWQIDWRE